MRRRLLEALLAAALAGNREGLERGLAAEMEGERAADQAYWAPLRRELEELRRHGGDG
jgi:hypothetical protein